jgi:hypoxanthine phosphoribosyltransferase
MYLKKPVIPLNRYIDDMYNLSSQIQSNEFDCLVCLKRSGFILGVFLSNQKTLPLFTPSEIKSIPLNFTRILVVDDKIYTGKSLNKAVNKLPLLSNIKTACMYVESDKYPDIWISKLSQIHRMWYERE